MNKFQHDIDRVIYLLHSNKLSDNTRINYRDIGRLVDRIGNQYSVTECCTSDVKAVNIHAQEVCKEENPECSTCELCQFCKFFKDTHLTQIKKRDFKLVDLFCGAGGFSLGFNQVGFKTVYAIDHENCCVETYRFNHNDVAEERIVCKDISNIGDDLDKLVRNYEIDVVIGGPPCQGFSVANRQRMINDPRNKLYKYFVETISRIKPRFFVMENVEGILKIKDEIIEDFASLDITYKVMPFKVNALEFGVPQNRRRVFFIGTRLDTDLNMLIENILRNGKMNPQTVLDDALYGMKQLSANTRINTHNEHSDISGSKIDIEQVPLVNDYISRINNDRTSRIVYNHKARYNNNRDIEIFTRLNPGDKSDDPKIADIMPYSSRNHIFKDKYFRLQGDKPCKTITAHMRFDCNMYIHPREHRGLTPREAARVQSYPDYYYFTGPYTKTYMQIGNSVPPLVAKAIASAIKEVLARR